MGFSPGLGVFWCGERVVSGLESGHSKTAAFALFCSVLFFNWKRNADLRDSSLFFLFSFLTMTNSG